MEMEGLMNGDWQEMEGGSEGSGRDEGWTVGPRRSSGRLIWNESEEPARVKATIYITGYRLFISSHKLPRSLGRRQRDQRRKPDQGKGMFGGAVQRN